MATQTGYKASELGDIPQDWEISTIKDVILGTMQNGLFYEPSRKKGKALFINVGDMYLSSPIKTDLLGTFQANEQEIKKFRVYNGDLLFTRSSIVPEGIAFCNFYASEQIALFDSHLIKIRANRNLVLPAFLYLNCISKFARKFFVSNAKMAIMTTIDQKAIGNCPVLLPSIFEQTAIATALSDTDALISSLQTLIAKKNAIKLSAMQNLLGGKIRLPEFAKRPDGSPKTTSQTELGCVPEDWEVVELGEVCDILSGINLSQNSKGSYPVTRIETIANGNIDLNRIGYVETSQDIENYKLNYGDILFSNINSLDHIGKTAFYSACYELYHGTNLLRLVAKNINAKFLFENLNSKPQRIFFQKIANQAVSQASINRTQLSKTLILKPKSIPEQTAIAQLLSDMDAEIEALECRLKKTQAIKQGMMQALLTGKIRLPFE